MPAKSEMNLVTIRFCVEDQQPLLALLRPTVAFGSHKNAQLQGHVEARELVYGIWFGPRDIVNAVPALLDQAIELLTASLSTVIKLARRSRQKSASTNPKNQGMKGFGVVVVERTVDEDIVRRGSGQSSVDGERFQRPDNSTHIVKRNGRTLGYRLEYACARNGASAQGGCALVLGMASAGFLFRGSFHDRMVRLLRTLCKVAYLGISSNYAAVGATTRKFRSSYTVGSPSIRTTPP
jgi:hypothetical protein